MTFTQPSEIDTASSTVPFSTRLSTAAPVDADLRMLTELPVTFAVGEELLDVAEVPSTSMSLRM